MKLASHEDLFADAVRHPEFGRLETRTTEATRHTPETVMVCAVRHDGTHMYSLPYADWLKWATETHSPVTPEQYISDQVNEALMQIHHLEIQISHHQGRIAEIMAGAR